MTEADDARFRRPRRRELVVASGYVAAAALYVLIGVTVTDFLLSVFVAIGVPAHRRLARAARRPAASVSWAAHDLEPYAIQRHTRWKIAFVPLLLGSYAPDMMTKWFVYGIHLGPVGPEGDATPRSSIAAGRASASRTRSSTAPSSASFFWKGFGSKLWGISFMIGEWAHALTDTGDTVGTMLLFPWTYPLPLRRVGVRGPDRPDDRRRGVLQRPRRDVGPGLDRLRAVQLARADAFVLRAPRLHADRSWSFVNRAVPTGRAARPLPGRLLLRHEPLDRVDDLGARHPPLPVRPVVGRAALGARRASVSGAGFGR